MGRGRECDWLELSAENQGGGAWEMGYGREFRCFRGPCWFRLRHVLDVTVVMEMKGEEA